MGRLGGQLLPVLWGCKTGIYCTFVKRAGRGDGQSAPIAAEVLQMLQVCRWQRSEQRRQGAPHMAEVLQNLSVNRSNATSCHSRATPRERGTPGRRACPFNVR